jgi:hypothetical protein
MVNINPDKSEVMCFKGKNDQSNLYTFGGKEISRVSNLKHLDITKTTNGKVNLESITLSIACMSVHSPNSAMSSAHFGDAT